MTGVMPDRSLVFIRSQYGREITIMGTKSVKRYNPNRLDTCLKIPYENTPPRSQRYPVLGGHASVSTGAAMGSETIRSLPPPRAC